MTPDHGDDDGDDRDGEDHDLGAGQEIDDGVLDLGHGDHLHVGQVVEPVRELVHVRALAHLDAQARDHPRLAESLLHRAHGQEDGPVILRAGALEDAHDLHFEVLLRDEVGVSDLALFELGRLVAHHGFERLGRLEPAALLELQEALEAREAGRVHAQEGAQAPALALVGVEDGLHEHGSDLLDLGFLATPATTLSLR